MEKLTEAIAYHINGLCYVARATPVVDQWHRKFSDIAFPFKYRICCTQYYYQTPLSNGFRRGRFQSLVTLKCTYWHTCGHSQVFYVWKYRTGILVLGKQFLFIYTVPGKNGNHTVQSAKRLYPSCSRSNKKRIKFLAKPTQNPRKILAKSTLLPRLFLAQAA